MTHADIAKLAANTPLAPLSGIPILTYWTLLAAAASFSLPSARPVTGNCGFRGERRMIFCLCLSPPK